jgi:DNA-3-methyladenine glycosylase I
MTRSTRKDEPIIRCGWVTDDPIYQAYHDTEWGVPEHDDRRLYEKLVLDGAQAGLSWITILKRREGYRRAFEGFDPERIAKYNDRDLARLMVDPGVIRNRLKLESAIGNARALLALQNAGRTLDEVLWDFVDGHTKQNQRKSLRDVPAETAESKALSKDLRRLGFSFVGPTIIYAFMQAIGMVNDHVTDCFRHKDCLKF